jgi:mRNA-degrading endonuclease RelE of RelBE toxin-antitoxin system
MPAARRFVKKIRDVRLKTKIQDALKLIMNDYRIGELKKGDLAGIYCYDVFHDGTNYEIAYRFEEQQLVILVIMIGTRENFYDELKRYLS